VDDASHLPEHQLAALAYAFSTPDALAPGAVYAVDCADIKVSRPLHFEARWRHFDDASSTRVEERPRKFASSKNEPNLSRRDRGLESTSRISLRVDSVKRLITAQVVEDVETSYYEISGAAGVVETLKRAADRVNRHVHGRPAHVAGEQAAPTRKRPRQPLCG